METLDKMAVMFRALIISSNLERFTIKNLEDDFKLLEGYSIPYEAYGFRQLEDMLRYLCHYVQVHGHGDYVYITPTPTLNGYDD
ncbi:uncharacterized protein LOC128269429 [Anopheles cruzii]|uniref:uncharacterized protein LOC128269429 n=1 Tax=Anopheles cruzii TaxID=68878 RepID=UPI0022EC61B1|nr:uncharacterized protein LOC128269429 [Anopheles cruzii]